MQQAEMGAKISLEQENKELVALSTANTRTEADARAYGMESMMKAFNGVDAKVLQSLAMTGMKPDQLIAAAFQDPATRAAIRG